MPNLPIRFRYCSTASISRIHGSNKTLPRENHSLLMIEGASAGELKMRREDVELSKSKSLSPEKKSSRLLLRHPRSLAPERSHEQTLTHRWARDYCTDFKVEKALATDEIRGQARRITLISTLASSLTSNRHERVAIVVNTVFQVRRSGGSKLPPHVNFFD